MYDFFGELWNQVRSTTWMEWLSTMSQFISVWYAKSNNILVYPTGIIGVLLAAYLYLIVSSPPLFGEGILHVYYFLISAFGWYRWHQKLPGQEIDKYKISYLSVRGLLTGLLFSIGSYLLIFAILKYYTNSDTVILDAVVSSSAILAMFWMANRKIEHWLVWIFSNAVAVPLNYYKGFVLFSLMYFIFLVLAWIGFLSWKKIYRDLPSITPTS